MVTKQGISTMAIMFTGQGSQFVGMGNDLLQEKFGQAHLVRQVQENTKTKNLLHFMCKQDTTIAPEQEKELTLTYNAQPAILTLEYALYQYLQAQASTTSNSKTFQTKSGMYNLEYVLGHSLGEFTALLVAGAFPFATALDLVHTRGKLMQDQVQESETDMAALMPCSEVMAQSILEQVHALHPSLVCNVANINSPQQV